MTINAREGALGRVGPLSWRAKADRLLPLLGVLGMVESLAFFAYVWAPRDNFVNFDRLFFRTIASSELLAQAVFLVVCLVAVIRLPPYFESREEASAMLLLDPLHSALREASKYLMAEEASENGQGGREASKRDALLDSSAGPLVLALLHWFFWASFYLLWGQNIGGNDDVKSDLSSVALLVVPMLAFLLYKPRSENKPLFAMALAFLNFAQKFFTVCYLVIGSEGVLGGPFGVSVILLQLTKILSVAGYFAAIVMDTASSSEEQTPLTQGPRVDGATVQLVI